MGMRRAQHTAKDHARHHHAVDITHVAAQQPQVLKPRRRLIQREFTHPGPPTDFPGYCERYRPQNNKYLSAIRRVQSSTAV
jgi:hypothetical protein